MPVSRSQIVAYAALAVAVLLIGARWIRASEPERKPFEASGGGTPVRVSRSGGRDVVVHVAGAVHRPGVYHLPAGSRVADAVERAGGSMGRGADGVNLAARLADGQQIVVPRAGGGTSTSSVPAAGEEGATGPVSLGSATSEQLQTIDGIGPKTADKIISYREEHGGFSSIEELGKVEGIGPKTLDSMRDRVQP